MSSGISRQQGKEVFIYDTLRSPRGRGKKEGSLHRVRPLELISSVVQALMKRNPIDTSFVQDVILGCVTPMGEQGGNIAKMTANVAGLSRQVSGVTINRFCASGLEAVHYGALSIMAGQARAIVAGGVESMSRVSIGSDGGAWGTDPEVARHMGFIPQGVSADLIASWKNFSRRDVDQFAVISHQRAAHAVKEGYFRHSIVPITNHLGEVLLNHDELVRPETSLESLSKLKASFAEIGKNFGFDDVAISTYPQVEKIEHVHHAGNSSGIVDGAAAVLLGDSHLGEEFSLRPRAKIRGMALTSTEPTIMLMGPTPAAQLALARAGVKKSDIDLFEVNEAFAAVVLNFMQEMDISHDKVNVNGGAIALGHPLGATGSMLLGMALDELERRDQHLALITLCAGGGMGIATVIERI